MNFFEKWVCKDENVNSYAKIERKKNGTSWFECYYVCICVCIHVFKEHKSSFFYSSFLSELCQIIDKNYNINNLPIYL